MKAYIVERDRLRNNIDAVKRKADGRAVYAVLKGNGYGLGMLQFAHELRDCGIERFAVTEPTDAIKLRLAGFIDEEILVMRSTADERDIADILEAKAVATIGSYESAVVLNGMAEKRGEVVEAHIKIDTGMGRYGFRESETDKILSIFRFMPKIAISGIYSHSNMAFSGGHTADDQLKTLLAAAEAIHAAGFDPGIIHFANSAFLFGHDASGTDAVRIGSAFLGRVAGRGASGLHPVGHAMATVTEVRWLDAGSTVGYGAAFRAKGPTRIAVVPFGYSDGFNLSRGHDIFRIRDKLRYLFGDIKLLLRRKRIYVTIRGKRAPVLGHIGMVHTVVNVTKIPCEVGDEVVFDLNPIYASPLLERIYE